MRASIIDVLRGAFADGRQLDEVTEEYWAVLSILGNLNRLFNTRRGSLLHLPAYGLPDISEVYRDMPDSITPLQTAIKEVVETFEPRLQRVRVIHQKTDALAMRLEFVLAGELPNHQKVQFKTTFHSGDATEVSRLMRRT